ncbi:MAG: TatD family hydrolase [Planctomycetes bacterium]|nr:TatD family hydrolase [Planctomycetota bacterium]
MSSLIDTHTHLDDPQFAMDLPQVLARASDNGVDALVSVGIRPESWKATWQLCQEQKHIHPVLGFHPNHLLELEDDCWPALSEWLGAHRPVAIGEIGLDYHWDTVPRERQQHYLRLQVRLAGGLGLPVVIHCREAYPDCLRILREECPSGLRGVLHCFSGDASVAFQALELGLHLSFGGPLTYPKSDAVREAARQSPLDRLLVETDCPYLTPQARRGKRNEPAFVRFTAEKLAEVRGMAFEEVAAATTANARQLFELRKDS